jgi:hypothetical protein
MSTPFPLTTQTELLLPMHKRVITQYLKNAQGQPELFLFYGDQEISFDEPELFAFGEALGAQSRFAAGAAMDWGTGYAWKRVQELLQLLLQAGILQLAPADVQPTARPDGARASPLPPAQATQARSWWECEAITRELTGTAIELAHLELVIPVFRIAHMALDTDGRQVGEANVFPKALRLDVPTNWRACIYPGSRFQDERPMNVTALKSMRAHWPAMLAAVARIREAYLQRFPAARAGWTVGDVERLSTLVLAIPTYALMQGARPVANGALHPVLSNLFRVSDGVRMTTHQMLFVPVAEATLSPLAPITGAEIYAYAERNHAFASTHGVCAGPRIMIEEFLAVLLDGTLPAHGQGVQPDAAVETALADMEAAFDYGLLGLQAHAVVFSLWPMMTRTYERLHTLAQQWIGPETEMVQRLRSHLQAKAEILKNETLHATEAWRANRERVYDDIYVHCAQGLGRPVSHSLTERIATHTSAQALWLKAQLRSLLRRQFAVPDWEQCTDTEALADCLAGYLLHAQALLDIAVGIQDRINTLLQRAPAVWAFSAADLDVHMLLQGQEARRLPHLLDELEALLGFRAVVSRSSISISIHTSNAQQPSQSCGIPEFADMVLASTRAHDSRHSALIS